jgi:transposase InsO family protein
MSRLLGVSTSGFYDWMARGGYEVSPSKLRLQEQVRSLFIKRKRRYGSPRIWRELKGMGISVGKGSVEAALKELGLRARVKKRYRTTTDSDHDRPVAQNLLKRDFSTRKKHEVWLSDITYLPLYGGGFLYLCVVMDLATREILGWHVDDNMETALVTNALKNAIGAHGSLPIGTIFHSDQGSQYASRELRTILAIYGMKQSMSRRGQCWDNAPMESFFSSLKKEYEEALEFTDLDDARSGLFDYIEIFYNRERMHSGIGYQVPACYMSEVSSSGTEFLS